MENMWSPWRSQYIESFKNENLKEEICIFCSALKNFEDNESLIIKIFEHSFIIMNLYPYNNGHLMVVPKRHLSNFSLLNAEEKIEIMNNIDLSIKSLEIVLKPHGYNVGANLGKVAGAGIDSHIHFHIVPRWNGDTNFMPVLGNVKVISQDLIITRDNLRKEMSNLIKMEI